MYETEYQRQREYYLQGGPVFKRRNQWTKSCKSCGRSNLHWGHTEYGWRLFTPEGVMHDCRGRHNQSHGPTMNKVIYELEKVKRELAELRQYVIQEIS